MEQIAVDHERVSNLEKEGWRPDPWKHPAGSREGQAGREDCENLPRWGDPRKVKQELFPPPKRGRLGKCLNLTQVKCHSRPQDAAMVRPQADMEERTSLNLQ